MDAFFCIRLIPKEKTAIFYIESRSFGRRALPLEPSVCGILHRADRAVTEIPTPGSNRAGGLVSELNCQRCLAGSRAGRETGRHRRNVGHGDGVTGAVGLAAAAADINPHFNVVRQFIGRLQL